MFFPSLFALFQYQLASSIQGYKYKLPVCRQLYCLPIGMNIILIAHFFFRKDLKSSEDYLLNCTMQKPCGLVSPTSCPHLVLPSVSVQCNIISSADVLAAKHWLEEQVSKGSKWNQYLLRGLLSYECSIKAPFADIFQDGSLLSEKIKDWT